MKLKPTIFNGAKPGALPAVFAAGIILSGALEGVANQQIVQTPLSGAALPKFVEPVPVFTNRADGTRWALKGDTFTITSSEFQQQLLPASFYAALPASASYTSQFTGAVVARINPRNGTYLWGYQVDDGKNAFGPSCPAVTIVSTQGVTSRIKMVNKLVPFKDLDGRQLSGPLLQKFLTVDQSFHWANPLNNPMTQGAMDMLTGLANGNPNFYSGPQPMVVHLHGSQSPSAFDGHPDAWFTPGLAKKGPGFVSDTYIFPNSGEPATEWYHDHTLGETRLNVYAGQAGFYFVRGGIETAVSPALPSGLQEVELAIQDKQFDTNGQLLWPDGKPSGAGLNGDPGNPGIHPYAVPEFYGDVMLVNGKSWPYLNVEPRRYRFRFLNGCNARVLALQLADTKGATAGSTLPAIWQIGSDGGLLDKPVNLNSFVPFTFNSMDLTTSPYGSPLLGTPRMLFAPGERMDVIVDFARFAGKTFTLINDGTHPFPGGDPVDPATDGLVMQFRVNKMLFSPDASFDPALPGAALRKGAQQMIRLADGLGHLAPGVKVDNVRRLTLIEQEDPDTGAPVKVLINNTHYDGLAPMGGFSWQNSAPLKDSVSFNNGTLNVTEMPQVGSTEIWEIVNLTPDDHPMHIHLVQYQMLNRQILNVGAPVPDLVPPYSTPPYFTTPGYRTDAFEASWFLDAGSTIGTHYGGGTSLPYVNPGQPMGGNPDVTPYLVGNPTPPDPSETGWKDTINCFPGTVTRLVVRWAPQANPVSGVLAGQNKFSFDPTTPLGILNDGFGLPGGPGYMIHCHIIDHEDNDMMRPIMLRKSAGH